MLQGQFDLTGNRLELFLLPARLVSEVLHERSVYGARHLSCDLGLDDRDFFGRFGLCRSDSGGSSLQRFDAHLNSRGGSHGRGVPSLHSMSHISNIISSSFPGLLDRRVRARGPIFRARACG